MQGVSSEEYIQMLFCFNDGVSWNIADSDKVSAYKKVSPVFIVDTGKWNICAIPNKTISFSKNVKVPLSYFRKIMNDYFDVGEIEVYQKKTIGRYIKSRYYSLYGAHFCGTERLHAISRRVGIPVSGKQGL